MNGKSVARYKLNNDNTLGKDQETSSRAQRFPIHLPIRFRTTHSPSWFVASTENVSCSGVLFRTECVFEPSTPLDLRLELPPIDGETGVHGEIVCKGEVVRMEPDGHFGVSPGVAVAIRNYRLAQRRRPN